MAVVIAVIVGAVVSGAAPVVLRPLLSKWSFVDHPNHRSSHVSPVLRGGGLAPGLGILAGTLIYVFLVPSGDALELILVVVIASIAGAIGLRDDWDSLSARVRLVAQSALGLVLGVALAWWLGSPWLLVPIVALAFVYWVNATNFMDGVDGISALHALSVGAALIGVGWLSGSGWIVASGGLLAASFGAFLPWNLVPPKLFLGDVGSYFLGAYVVTTVSAVVMQGVPFIAAFAPLAIYAADTGWTLLSRARRGERLTEAHRDHVYQQLGGRFSHLGSAGIVAISTLQCGILGWLVIVEPQLWLVSLVAIVIVASIYLSSPKWLNVVAHRGA